MNLILVILQAFDKCILYSLMIILWVCIFQGDPVRNKGTF